MRLTQTMPFEVASAISAGEGGGAAGALTFGALVAVLVAVAVAWAERVAAPKDSSVAEAKTADRINFVDKRFM